MISVMLPFILVAYTFLQYWVCEPKSKVDDDPEGINEPLNCAFTLILSWGTSPKTICPSKRTSPLKYAEEAVISPLRFNAEPEIVPTICKFPLLGSVSFTNVILSLDALLLPTCIVAKVLL